MQTFLPSDAWVRRILVPVVVFVALVSDRGYLADFWHHLARGRAMAESRQLVDHDLFTFTVPSQTFQDVNWLSQLGYFGLYQLGGLALVQVVNALMLAVTFGLLVEVCRRVSSSLFWACLVGAVVFLGSWHVLTIRPQTFSLLLFVLLMDVLERSCRRPILLLLPPFILAMWTNLHGAFPAGLLLVGCHFLATAWEGFRIGNVLGDRGTRRLGICLTSCIVATLVNPYGWGIYLYVGNTSSRAAVRGIDEWLPPTLDLWIGKALAISLVLAAVLLVLAWRKGTRPTVGATILLTCFLLLGCSSARMVPWWLLTLAPVATCWLALLWPRDETSATVPNLAAGVTCGVLVLAAVFALPGLQEVNPLLRQRLQPRVEGDLETVHRELRNRHPQGRVFTRFEWGEYLSWSYHPEHQIFMDGRIEIYPDQVWHEYTTVTCGLTGWQDMLDRYEVDALLLDEDYHARTGLLRQVEHSSHWRRYASAGRVQLYLRATPADETVTMRSQRK